MSLAWVGRSLAGWQFRQRGCVSTLAASAKIARDRSFGSEMEENVDGGRRVERSVCAKPFTVCMAVKKTNKPKENVDRIDGSISPNDNAPPRFRFKRPRPRFSATDLMVIRSLNPSGGSRLSSSAPTRISYPPGRAAAATLAARGRLLVCAKRRYIAGFRVPSDREACETRLAGCDGRTNFRKAAQTPPGLELPGGSKDLVKRDEKAKRRLPYAAGRECSEKIPLERSGAFTVACCAVL
jgi:hypothetical protein